MSRPRHPFLERLRAEVTELVADPERRMARLSLLASAAALALMLTGFVMLLVSGEPYHLPGARALPLHAMLQPPQPALAVDVMSLGIVLLLVLPVLRIMISMIPFVRRREWFDVVVTLVVFLELVFSMFSGK